MGIKFVEYDSEAIIDRLVEQFETALGETLQPSDERRIFLNNLAQVIVGINSNINETGNNVLLRYAKGEALDAIGEMLGVTRMEAGYAKCTLQYTLSEAQSSPITIPKGHKVTPDGVRHFATDKALTIPTGSLSGTVTATATQAGADYNGFGIGAIKYVTDNTVTFLASVSNTTASGGGSDKETDESLRERIRLVPESYTTAGSEEAYIYWAKSASNDVGDVVPYSTVNDTTLTEEEREAGAGKVYIYFLKADGTLPDTTNDKELIDTIQQVVSAEDVRPLTDWVIVAPPETVPYSVKFDYYISEENSLNESAIISAVNEAVNTYVKWQGEKIGRDINPDRLRQLVLNAGASRVVFTDETFVFTVVKKSQVASLTGTALGSYKGVSE